MERLERAAVIAELIETLHEHKSWCGETHVQKAMYLLQELTGNGAGFDFVLYKHGPFSFDLRDELTAMRADYLIELEIRRPDYGPTLKPTPNLEALSRRHREVVDAARPAIEFIGECVGDRTVVELERLGTALYFRRKHAGEDEPSVLARKIVEIKPHISERDALKAVKTVVRWEKDAAAVLAL